MNDFIQRLRERKLVQWTIAYVAFAFALLQGIDVVAQRFGWPDLIERYLILALAVGFFVVLVMAWYHGERGTQKVTGVELLILALLLVIGGTLIWRFGPAVANRTGALATQPVPAGATTAAMAVRPAITPSPIAAHPIPAKSVAVLPLTNESGDKDQQYFSDGLSEDLITALSQFSGLKVISRDSSFRFRNSSDSSAAIGAKLGVAHLLEGSVQKLGNEVRINAELVNAADGSTLWSQHYDRPYKDLFTLQDAITQAVALELKAKLLNAGSAVTQSDRPPSGSLDAYNAYQQGQFDHQRGSETALRQAIAKYTEATHLDPDYAAAYAREARVWMQLAGFYLGGADIPGAYAKARTLTNTALRLDPDLAKAHLANAALIFNADLDWSGAGPEIRRAVELAPGNAEALFSLAAGQASSGHVEAALGSIQQALAKNPLNAFWHDWQASYLGALGRFDEAEAAARQSIHLEPQQTPGYRELTFIEVLRGNATAALSAAQQAPPGRNHDIAMAWALQIGSRPAVADASLQSLIAKHAGDSSYQIAEAYALRRDPDRVFKWLDMAWANRDNGIQYLIYDPLILRYQHDSRFAAFCRKVGLPTTTDAKALP
jgi:TolB-like protein/Tfp pilus assembly protein PilF